MRRTVFCEHLHSVQVLAYAAKKLQEAEAAKQKKDDLKLAR